LALAGRLGVPALMADLSWQEIAMNAGIEVEVIRGSIEPERRVPGAMLEDLRKAGWQH
jgi:hypothetical protein